MPFITALEVMGAVFNLKQIAALKTVARRDGSYAYGLGRCQYTTENISTPRAPRFAVSMVDDLTHHTKAKCITEDVTWEERLMTTEFWKSVVAKQAAETAIAADLMKRLSALRVEFIEAAKSDPALDPVVRHLKDIREPHYTALEEPVHDMTHRDNWCY